MVLRGTGRFWTLFFENLNEISLLAFFRACGTKVPTNLLPKQNQECESAFDKAFLDKYFTEFTNDPYLYADIYEKCKDYFAGSRDEKIKRKFNIRFNPEFISNALSPELRDMNSDYITLFVFGRKFDAAIELFRHNEKICIFDRF